MKVIPAIVLIICMPFLSAAQEKDSVIVADSVSIVIPEQKVEVTDTLKVVQKRKHNPGKAALRSAILPGWGQVYNKKYWKVPIVYTAIGIPVGLFFNNKTWYNRTRFALAVVAGGNNPDSVAMVHSQLKVLVESKATGSLLRYRNEFRRDMDYAILFTLLFWGLNIVDATVDGHLKEFDVSEDLSLKIKPALLPGNAYGMSLVFTIGKH